MFLGWRVWVRSFFVFFLTTFYLFSLPLEIKTEESYELSSHMEFTAVNEFNESVDVLNNRQWHKEKKNVLLKEKHKSYWIKIELKHFLQKDKEYYFILPRNYIYFIEYFLIKENTIIENSSHGYFLQEKKNKLNSTHIIFPLNIKKNEQLTVYFKVQNYNMRNIPMKLTNSSYLIDFYQSYDFFQGIFFGVMLIMALYNFILYCILRFKPYLNYVFYAFSLSVYMAAYSGFFHRYTDLHPAFIYFLLIFGGVLFLLSSAKFFRVLFEFKKQLPRINTIAKKTG